MKQTRTILLIAVMFLARIVMAQESAFGYGANATGGGNATPIIVTNVTELSNALKADGNKVILVSGTITFTDHLSVQATDKTLMGLPGSKLVSNEQNKDNSGILYFKSGSNNLILRNLTFEGPGAYDCDGWDLLCFDGVTVQCNAFWRVCFQQIQIAKQLVRLRHPSPLIVDMACLVGVHAGFACVEIDRHVQYAKSGVSRVASFIEFGKSQMRVLASFIGEIIKD